MMLHEKYFWFNFINTPTCFRVQNLNEAWDIPEICSAHIRQRIYHSKKWTLWPLWTQSHNCGSSIPKIIHKKKKTGSLNLFSHTHYKKIWFGYLKIIQILFECLVQVLRGVDLLRFFAYVLLPESIISELDINYKYEISQFLGKYFVHAQPLK